MLATPPGERLQKPDRKPQADRKKHQTINNDSENSDKTQKTERKTGRHDVTSADSLVSGVEKVTVRLEREEAIVVLLTSQKEVSNHDGKNLKRK